MILDAIDLRTVFLLTTFVSMTTAAAMMFLWRSHPDDGSLPVWALGGLLVAAGYMGVALRGWLPLFLSIPLANACIASGHACFLVGIDRMTGRKWPAAWAILGLAVAVMASLSYFTYMQSSTVIRMAIQFVVLGLLSVITAQRLLAAGDAENRLPHRAAAIVFMVFGLTLLIRVGLMPFDVPEQNLFAPRATHQVVFVIMLLFYAALMYCFPALLFAKEIMQRQRVEASLRDRESDYRSFLETTLDGFWVVDSQGKLIEVNERYAQQSGYTREDLLAMSVSDLEAIESLEATAVHIQRVIENGRDQFETRHRRKDGSIWNVEVTAIYLPANGGKFFGFFRDITERKRIETAVVLARNQLQATLSAIPDLLFEMDLEGRYYDAYATNTDLLAVPVDALLSGRDVHDVLPAGAAEVTLSALREANESGRSHGKQVELAVPQGRRWFELSVAKKAAEPERASRFVVLSRDITERKQAEIALRTSTEKLEEAQRIARVGSWTLDLVSGELTWSAEVFRLFEIDPSRFGATYEAFLNAIHPDDRDAVNKAYTDSLVTRQPYEVTHRLRMDDGRMKWVQERCRSDFDEAGNPLRSMGTVQDVTERELAEIALRQSEASKAAILDSVAATVAVLDRNGVILEVNEPWRRFALDNGAEPGKPESHMGVGTNYLDVCAAASGFSSEYAPEAHIGIRAVLEGRLTSFRLEYPCHSPTQQRWFIMMVVPLGHKAGDGVVVTHTDVTPIKYSEEQLRIAAAAFESQECMMVTDANSVILRVNHAFTESTGYASTEVIGQTPRLFQSGRHRKEFYREMWDTIQRTGSWQGEVWDRRKNGEVYPKWLTISAVKDGNGAVTHYIGAHYDITDRKQAEEKISHLAFFDQLTGLPNRTLLQDRMKQAMAASVRRGSRGALLFIDLDNFKTLNDTLGHDMGDQLLKQVAQRLTQCVRDGDTVARLGGDEFVVVLAGLNTNEAEAASDVETVAEKILFSLSQAYSLSDVAYRTSASIGITLFKDDPATIDELMKQADLAMYKSKEAGRNALSFFDPGMASAVQARVAMEDDLRRGLDEKQFRLNYQAQVAGGQVTGAEVLVRWQHPARGTVSPAEFISLAEGTGLILPLGRWVLETACTQLALWAAEPGMAHLTVAVNVSAHQFRQADFVDQVLMVINDTGANPQRLKLELTESMLVHDVDEMIEKMLALKVKGVAFSLDDFGTGYSSLSYLKRLPLDQLKIDRSFVRDVLIDPNDAAIARTVVALAQSLGLGVIAEGVETEAQKDFLASSGCHAYQGYFFSRPLAVEAFERFAQDMACQA